MKLDVQVSGKTKAQLYRERDEYVLQYLPGSDPADFVSLTMPVRPRLNVVPVAQAQMSDDGRVLVVERFDVDAHGSPTHGLAAQS